MPTSKDTKDFHVEKERGKVASGMQYQGQEIRTVGHMAKFMIEFIPYDGNINGEFFSQFVRDRFSYFFRKGNNQKGKLFLQDEDPSWNCKMSQEAINKIPYRLFMIPPKSSD